MRKLIAGVATAAAVVSGVGAHAQAPFADVPRDHWAYDAVNSLAQQGLIIGYPEGTFGGKRAMTRYEFAVVIARMIPQLEQKIQDAINAIPDKPTPTASSPVDTSGLASQADLDTLKKLVDQFSPELQMLQVDVAGIKRDLNELRGRVGVLEKKVDRVQISGEMTGIARLSDTSKATRARIAGSGGTFAALPDLDGRPLNGTGKFLEASQFAYDMDLGIKIKATDTVTANALLNIGNYVGGYSSANGIFNSLAGIASPPYGTAGVGSAGAEITPWKAYISAPISAGPLGRVNLEAGKTGVQFTPYTLKLVDYDSYTNITKTDNGEVVFTGLKGSFKVGGVGITAFGGTNGNALFSNGNSQAGMPLVLGAGAWEPNDLFYNGAAFPISTSVAHNLYAGLPVVAIPVTQSAGVRATVGLPFNGTLGLNYVGLGTNNGIWSSNVGIEPGTVKGDIRHAEVYGADLALKLNRGIGIKAEYANSDLLLGSSLKPFGGDSALTENNLHDAYDVRANFGIKSIALSAGYRQVDPFFAAPGAWGSIGTWKNPTNIKGFVGTVGVPITRAISLAGSYEDYKSIVAGTGAAPLGGTNANPSDGTKIQHWTAGLKFNVTPANRVDLGVEQSILNPNDGGSDKALQTFYNIGFGTKVTDNSSFKLLYQIIDYRDRGADLLYNGNDARGSVAIGQFQVKF